MSATRHLSSHFVTSLQFGMLFRDSLNRLSFSSLLLSFKRKIDASHTTLKSFILKKPMQKAWTDWNVHFTNLISKIIDRGYKFFSFFVCCDNLNRIHFEWFSKLFDDKRLNLKPYHMIWKWNSCVTKTVFQFHKKQNLHLVLVAFTYGSVKICVKSESFPSGLDTGLYAHQWTIHKKSWSMSTIKHSIGESRSKTFSD